MSDLEYTKGDMIELQELLDNTVANYKSRIYEVINILRDDNKYLDWIKLEYLNCENEKIKATAIQLINNNLIQNDDVIEMLEDIIK